VVCIEALSYKTGDNLQDVVLSLKKTSPSNFISKFAKGASVCHHLTGKCWEPRSLSNSELSFDPSLFHTETLNQIDSTSRMAWIQGRNEDSNEFDTNGLVMIKSKEQWKILRLNVTDKVANHIEKFGNSKPISLEREPLKIKVMSFNIRYGTANDGNNKWENRDHLVFKVLNDYQPDLVGLQEALLFQIEEIVENNPKYKWIGVGRDNGADAGEFSAILYDYSKFDVLEQGTFWYCDRPTVPGCISYGNSIPRICTWGRFISKQTGRTFFHYNTHLDHQSVVSREKSSQQLLDFIYSKQTADPTMITGDFNNNSEQSKEIVTLTNSSFVDTFRVLHPNATSVGTFHGFNGNDSGTKIDYVFGSALPVLGGPCKVEQASIIKDNDNGRYPSDHFPVDATLIFN